MSGRPEPALAVRGLTKRYAGVLALDGVDLSVAPGSLHALLGANGSGKSTLIRVVAGVERADAGGTVSVGGAQVRADRTSPAWSRAAGVRVVHQGTSVFPDLTVAENIGVVAGLPTRPGGSIRWRAARADAAAGLARLGLTVDPAARMGSLSPAVQTLVAVARALADVDGGGSAVASGGPKLLILDEPTAALPAAEAATLLAGLRSLAGEGHAVVLVTHRLDEVTRAADEATVLRDSRTVARVRVADTVPADLVALVTGAVTPVASSATIDPGAGDGGGATAGARAAARREASGASASSSGSSGGAEEPEAAEAAPLLEVDGLAVGPLRGVSFTVAPGEVVGIAGLLGSGRSALLEALFGARPRRGGTVQLVGAAMAPRSPAHAMTAGVALVPEQRERALFPARSLAENLSVADLGRFRRRGRIDRGGESRAAADDVERYGIRARSVAAPVRTLSGGNQQKAVVARWLRRDPTLLLLDEPTLGVDVGARAEIHALVRRFVAGGHRAVLCVSSDAEELCALADRVLVLHDGRLVGELRGADAHPEAVAHLSHGGVAA
ncbi:MAG: sugar ABC transporter ATP-binding protein [Acidimicrobiales bacterium]|nr:sugar ABC transporter ATP-binding protein [Acidimicrobiales bacterium]